MIRPRFGYRLAAAMLFAVLFSVAAAAPDSLARDVGIAAILEPGPPYVFTAGDTIHPRALVRNYGTETVRNFDVRFRIDPVYERTLVVPVLEPGTGLELRFQPWEALPGSHVVTCSTRLADDENPENDRRLVTIRVLQPPALYIERDQADRIEIGATRRYNFHAEIHGDTGDSIRLRPLALPPGWRYRYYDSTGTNPLPGTDSYELGRMPPRQRHRFILEIAAPAILADTSLPTVHALPITGFGTRPGVEDSAMLILTLVPGLQVHNYPNPLETQTTFIIGIPENAVLSLAIYDRLGTLIRRLIDSEPASGPAVIQRRWDGTNQQGRLVAPGTYQYLLEASYGNRTRRVQKRLVVTRD